MYIIRWTTCVFANHAFLFSFPFSLCLYTNSTDAPKTLYNYILVPFLRVSAGVVKILQVVKQPFWLTLWLYFYRFQTYYRPVRNRLVLGARINLLPPKNFTKWRWSNGHLLSKRQKPSTSTRWLCVQFLPDATAGYASRTGRNTDSCTRFLDHTESIRYTKLGFQVNCFFRRFWQIRDMDSLCSCNEKACVRKFTVDYGRTSTVPGRRSVI